MDERGRSRPPRATGPALWQVAGGLLGALLAASCRGGPEEAPKVGEAAQVTIGDVRWYVDYDAAVEVARQAEKALWVHFGENPG